MRNLFFKSSKNVLHELFRALTYSASITTIFFVLILCKNEDLPNLFKLFSGFGLVLILLESIFTIYDIDSIVYKESHHKLSKTKNLLSHSFNHLFYPVAFYLGLSTYIRFVTNLFVAGFLVLLGFFLYLSYFVNLRKHLHSDHTDVHLSKKVSYKIDTLFNFFKFFSYFIVVLSVFQLHSLLKISINQTFIILILINVCYLLFHVNRKHELSNINILMAILFALITSFFIIQAKTSVLNATAGIATVIFYISSGIYYHKVDGTLNYRILIEYASIATILSIYLFSF